MLNSKRREKVLGVLTGILVLTVVMYGFIVEPQVNRRKELLKELYQKQTMFTKMQADIMAKDRIENNYSRIESLIRSGGNDQEEMSAFSQEFQKINAKFNLKPRMIKFLPVVNDPYFRKILVRVEFEGGIESIAAFISSVENGKKAMKFEKASFVVRDRDDNIQFSFVLSKVVSNVSSIKTHQVQGG